MRPKKIKSEKYVGVYIQKSAVREDDEVYYISYRDQHGRACYEKVGWKNEGYTEKEASKVRSARIHEIRHGKELPIRKAEISDSNPASKALPEGEQFREHIDKIRRLLTETKLDWLEPYIYTAIGLFKGFAPLQPSSTGTEPQNDPKTGSSVEWQGMSLEAFMAGIELFKKEISRELSLQDIHMILLSIANDGISLQEIREIVGLTPGAMTRNLKRFGLTRNQKVDGSWEEVGHEIIDSYRSSSCLKMKKVSLTERGKEFAEKLKRVLATGEVPVKRWPTKNPDENKIGSF